VTTAVFAMTFVLSAGVLAVWVDLRYPTLVPSGLRPLAVHLLVAILANSLLVAPLAGLVVGSVPEGRVVAVIGVILPLVTYACLAGVWTLRVAQSALSGRLR